MQQAIMTLEGRCCGPIVGLVAVLLLCADHGETAGRGAKRRRCMVVKNEWRSKGFGDNQQVPSSPISGERTLGDFIFGWRRAN